MGCSLCRCALSPCGRGRRRSLKYTLLGEGLLTPHPFFRVEPLSSPLPQGERAQQQSSAIAEKPIAATPGSAPRSANRRDGRAGAWVVLYVLRDQAPADVPSPLVGEGIAEIS